MTSLEELTTGIEAHVENLAEIEEPLQRAFTAEALANIRSKSDVDQADIEEVFLRDRMARFREMREDKERILCKLWDEWEDIQFELISLAIEVLGDEALGIPFGEEALKPGQKERLDNTCESAQQIHEHINVQHGNLEQDLTSFKEVMTQITDTTKKTVADTQQVHLPSLPTRFCLLSIRRSNTTSRRIGYSKVSTATLSFLLPCETEVYANLSFIPISELWERKRISWTVRGGYSLLNDENVYVGGSPKSFTEQMSSWSRYLDQLTQRAGAFDKDAKSICGNGSRDRIQDCPALT